MLAVKYRPLLIAHTKKILNFIKKKHGNGVVLRIVHTCSRQMSPIEPTVSYVQIMFLGRNPPTRRWQFCVLRNLLEIKALTVCIAALPLGLGLFMIASRKGVRASAVARAV